MNKSKEERVRPSDLFKKVKNNDTLSMLGNNDDPPEFIEKKASPKPIQNKSEIKTEVKTEPKQTGAENAEENVQIPANAEKKKSTAKKPVRDKFQILCYLTPEEYGEFDEMFLAVRKEMITTKGIKVKESNLATLAIKLCKEQLFDKNKKEFLNLISQEL